MKLNSKLIIIMLSLLVIAILALFILNQFSQNDLVKEIQESTTEISKAFQISVEDLTSETTAESSKLKEYLKEARHKGINEINIINNEGEIINSSDPDKIGIQRDVRKLEKGLKVSTRYKTAGVSRPYDLLVPVIVGDEQYGYIQVNLLLDNVREIQHENFLRRLLATSLVFALGIMLTIFLARRYTSPINNLAQEVKKVSAGDLSVTFPEDSRDEIGELAESLNEMVQKLRERESLEKRLSEAEHLSRVGQLASGIAHEIRNPLNYISLAVDHIKTVIMPSCGQRHAEAEVLLDKVKEEVRRANYMVLNFMNYGRPLKIRLNEVSYREILEKALPVLKDKLTEQRIDLIVDIDPKLPSLKVDTELMRNCLFNFITNAAQAMPNGGEIRLGATYDETNKQFRLTFTDQGVGIPEESQDKIFQPYFTTKEAGIGLGLAITERIIKEHGGEIEVASTEGKGTVFTVVLPDKK